jgi:hypothetical protein
MRKKLSFCAFFCLAWPLKNGHAANLTFMQILIHTLRSLVMSVLCLTDVSATKSFPVPEEREITTLVPVSSFATLEEFALANSFPQALLMPIEKKRAN